MADYVLADTAEAVAIAKRLIEEYAESLGCSPCLRNIEQELRSFPQPFAPPHGRIIVGMANGQAAGVVGIKRIDARHCEMARLYVRPRFRGTGLGRGLALQALASGKTLGYLATLLYTLPSMTTACSLYRGLGFVTIDPYTEHPVEGAIYMRYLLQETGG